MQEILVFPSTYHMLRSEELLKRRGYVFRLVPAPPQAGELCTTAIAVSSREREEITRYLEGEKVLLKAVLPYEGRLERSLAEALEELSRERALFPSLAGVLDAMRAGEQPGAEGIAELLTAAEGEEGGIITAAAERLARDYFGGKVAALVGLRLDVEGAGASRGSLEREKVVGKRDAAGSTGLREILHVAEEMTAQGLVHLLLDMGDMEEFPWTPPELRQALGDGIITVVTAASLLSRAGEMVREGAVRQFLLRRDDVFSLDARGLAEEIVFLRDNRPGPVGSGNLLPLLAPKSGAWGEGELRRLRAVLAACRLVLGDAFLPAPPLLWREGKLAGANMLVLDATDRPLAEAAGEAEERARESGLSVMRVRRRYV